MWSEELDKKIQSTADSKQPAFDEKAWDKMESLLDKHLPQEKKRRRIIFLLFIFLLTGSALLLMLQKSKNPSGTADATKNSTTTPVAAFEKNDTGSPDPQPSFKSEKELQITPPASRPITNPIPGKIATPLTSLPEAERSAVVTDKPIYPRAKPARKNLVTPVATTQSNYQKDFNSSPSITSTVAEDKTTSNQVSTPKSSKSSADMVSTGSPAIKISDSTAQAVTATKTDSIGLALVDSTSKIDSIGLALVDSTSKIDSIGGATVAKKPATATKRFGFTISTGPDVSTVGLNQTGKLKMQYGIGVSYDISNRITLRTGIYASRKVYTADSADYHPPKDFLNYYSNLQKIDANCMVYEIPISIVYNFESSLKHNWFASTGISSYIMKSEEYYYAYRNAWGQPQYSKKELKNENSHLFSILQVSGGYQFRISNSFSLMAEPYVKIPLAGVGFGKVRLGSGGILFTATLKPFAGKK